MYTIAVQNSPETTRKQPAMLWQNYQTRHQNRSKWSMYSPTSHSIPECAELQHPTQKMGYSPSIVVPERARVAGTRSRLSHRTQLVRTRESTYGSGVTVGTIPLLPVGSSAVE